MPDLAIRPATLDDLEQIAHLGRLAFGGPPRRLTAETTMQHPGDVVVAEEGDRLVAVVGVHRFTQSFAGRGLPCAGVSSVVVAPDARGRGLARALLDEATAAMRARGEVVSALFPTTASLYRGLGYEVAGWWARRAVPVAEMPAPSGAVTWSPASAADPAVADVWARGARAHDGWVVPGDVWWRGWAARDAADGTAWTWVGRRDGAPVAVVTYATVDGERSLFDLRADVVAGVDGPALADALAFLGANGTSGDRVRTTLPAAVLARHVPQASRLAVLEDWPWMLRLLDLPGAVAARGGVDGLRLEVHLDVAAPVHAPDDPVAGRWVVRVEGPEATCEPGGAGTVTVDATDLAALFTGHLSPVALASEGRLRGAGDAAVRGLAALLAGSPSLPTFF